MKSLISGNEKASHQTCFFGAGGGGRTRTLLPGPDFESGTSANSIMPARESENYFSAYKRFLMRQ